jgi:hypothetical protein
LVPILGCRRGAQHLHPYVNRFWIGGFIGRARRVFQNALVRIYLCAQLGKLIGTTCVDVSIGQRTLELGLLRLFRRHPILRSHILDDSGRLRHRVAIFINSALLSDPIGLSHVVPPKATLHIMRSLGPPVTMCWSSDWRARRLIGCSMDALPKAAAPEEPLEPARIFPFV